MPGDTMVSLLSASILHALKSFQCYVLSVMPGLRSPLAGDETAGIGNAGFGFAVEYRFPPWRVPSVRFIGERGQTQDLASSFATTKNNDCLVDSKTLPCNAVVVCALDSSVSCDSLTVSRNSSPHHCAGGLSESWLCLFQTAGLVFAILGRHCVMSACVHSQSDHWGRIIQ